MITKPYNALLFVAALTLAGCQTAPFQVISQDENVVTMQVVDIDSDGDGILDQIDHCPKTPKNIAVNELGCHILYDLIDKTAMELRVFFKKDSSDLTPEYQLELDKVAEQMSKYDAVTMQIEAHISEDEMGQALSVLPKNRAMMVKNYLVLKHDIEPSRLSTFDCGIRAPIASADTEEGKSFNRRVYGLVKEPKINAYNYPADSASKICVEF
jgi:OOP family OmpA-OmpF porin